MPAGSGVAWPGQKAGDSAVNDVHPIGCVLPHGKCGCAGGAAAVAAVLGRVVAWLEEVL